VNLGGEPERDDSGLPPVDIVVPDDARELDRDVQAYRRELRALRRHQRRMRWHGPATRDGVILPLLASCLVLAVIAGTLLTFLTARPGGEPAAGRRPAASAQPSSARPSPTVPPDSPVPALSPHQFPVGAVIMIGGQRDPASNLTGRVYALIPANCSCATVLTELVDQAAAADVLVSLVGGAHLAPVTEISALVTKHQWTGISIADDVNGTLATTYLTADQQVAGGQPSVLLVGTDGKVRTAASLPEGFHLTSALAALGASLN
jgi:hypothetical protein